MVSGGIRRLRSKETLGIMVTVIGSLGIMGLLDYGNLETKWAVYILGALLLGAIAFASGNLQKCFFILFILGLQIAVALHLGDDSLYKSRSVGQSEPPGFIVRFMTIPAMVLLLQYWLIGVAQGHLHMAWGKEITYPAFFLFLTTMVTILYTPEKWLVLYYVFELLQLYMVFLVMMNIVTSRKDVDLVVKLLLITLGIQCVVYFIQNSIGMTFSLTGAVSVREGDIARHGGTVATRLHAFASFIMPLVFIAISRFMTMSTWRHRIWTGPLAVMGGLALVLTYTRASWMGFILGFAWLLAVGAMRRMIRPRRVLFLVDAIVLVVVLLLPKIMIRLSHSYSAAYTERVLLMKMAWNVITAHPLLGVGAGAYGYVFQDYLTPELREKGVWVYMVHNIYLRRWAETGLFGLLSFLGVFAVGLRQALVCTRSRDPAMSSVALGWSTGLIALLWEMFWDTNLGFSANSLIWLLFGLMLVIKRLDAEQALVERRQEAKVYAQWSPA